jgi:hypothetical protein
MQNTAAGMALARRMQNTTAGLAPEKRSIPLFFFSLARSEY